MDSKTRVIVIGFHPYDLGDADVDGGMIRDAVAAGSRMPGELARETVVARLVAGRAEGRC
jgi:hypothetical protein